MKVFNIKNYCYGPDSDTFHFSQMLLLMAVLSLVSLNLIEAIAALAAVRRELSQLLKRRILLQIAYRKRLMYIWWDLMILWSFLFVVNGHWQVVDWQAVWFGTKKEKLKQDRKRLHVHSVVIPIPLYLAVRDKNPMKQLWSTHPSE